MGRDISISEVMQFMRCRRAWDFQSPHRQGLRKIGMPSSALHIGSGVHEALAANAAGESWSEALSNWASQELGRFTSKYIEAVGAPPSPSELESFDQAYDAALLMLTRYFNRYGEENPLGDRYRYLKVEQTYRVPIPGTDGTFVLTIDGLAQEVGTDNLWIVEHKTYSTKPEMDRLSTDHQFTAYAWAAGALFGQPISGILYDGISKKIPSKPALLKSGKLSEAWTETIDYQSYATAVVEAGLDPHDYDAILARLAERDAQTQTPFFTRWKISVLPAQIDSFANYISAIYRDMTADPGIYPNFPFAGCWDCSVRDLCKAVQFGEDVQWLINTSYVQGGGSQSFRQRGGQEVPTDALAVLAPDQFVVNAA